jgi:membrane fusion protein (multidrug efflux system)
MRSTCVLNERGAIRSLVGWVCAVLLLGGCTPEVEELDFSALVPPVMVEPVEAWDVIDRIEATGELRARNDAVVSSQVGGQVTAVLVDDGDAVEIGQSLVEIDPERRELELRTALAGQTEAEAGVSEAKREMRRIKQLSDRNAASTSQVDEAATRLKLAEARLGAARAGLGLARRARADSTVVAPFAGLVADRMVSQGEYLSVGQPLIEIVDLDPIEVEFRLAEVDSGRVKLEDPVAVQVAPHPGESFEAVVSSIAPTIDVRSRTLRVKALLNNADGRLRPGTFARVDLGVAKRSGVPMISEEAVIQRSDGSVVFRLVGKDRVERLRVRTGVHREGYVELGEPIEVGDLVLVRGQVSLIDGAFVSVRTADGQLVDRPDVPVAVEAGQAR